MYVTLQLGRVRVSKCINSIYINSSENIRGQGFIQAQYGKVTIGMMLNYCCYKLIIDQDPEFHPEMRTTDGLHPVLKQRRKYFHSLSGFSEPFFILAATFSPSFNILP